MTEEQFNQFQYEDLPSAMFHVMSDYKDDDTEASLKEVILVKMLAENPGALKHKPLKEWVDEYVGQCYSEDVKKNNEEVLKKTKKDDSSSSI